MERSPRLTGTDLIRRSDALLTAEVDGELMAMSVEKGVCYGLDSIGTRIWSLICEPRSIDEVCDVLLSEFEVDRVTCRHQVIALLDELRGEGLVAVQAGPDEPPPAPLTAERDPRTS